MKIDLFTICYNESRIIPFVVDYWKRLGVRHAYVFDNCSTDGSAEMLRAHGDWITVIPFDTGNVFNDQAHIRIKNNCWKISDADYVVVCDLDEVLWHEDLPAKLEEFKRRGITLVRPNAAHLYREEFPTYDPDKLLHQHAGVRRLPDNELFAKCILFSPTEVKEINFAVGAHFCDPVGVIRPSFFEIDLLHLKYLGVEYLQERHADYARRLSEANRQHDWGVQYLDSADKLRTDFRRGFRKANGRLSQFFLSTRMARLVSVACRPIECWINAHLERRGPRN